jgi:Emfourin
MEPEDASELAELVREAGFFKLPNRLASTSEGRDRFQYRLLVASSTTRSHEVVVDGDSVPAELLPLLTRLTALALKQSPT